MLFCSNSRRKRHALYDFGRCCGGFVVSIRPILSHQKPSYPQDGVIYARFLRTTPLRILRSTYASFFFFVSNNQVFSRLFFPCCFATTLDESIRPNHSEGALVALRCHISEGALVTLRCPYICSLSCKLPKKS